MKIAIISEEYPPRIGGVAHSTERIVKNLNKLGIEIILLTYDYREEEYFVSNVFKPCCIEEKISDKLKVFRIGPISSKTNVLQPGFMSSQKRNFFHFLIEILNKEKPDIIHGFYILKSGFMAVLAGKKLGIPSVVSVRGNDISRDIFDFAKFGAIKWTLDNANFITFVNDRSLEDGRLLIKKKDNYKVILNACDTDRKEISKVDPKFLKERLGIKKDSFVIGFCGAVREKKGLPYLLEAFEMALKKDTNLHLLVVGNITKDFDNKAYFKYFNQIKFKDKITLTGIVPPNEVDNYYRLMDIFCVPSINDGLSNSLLEGLSLGLPTIASDLFSKILRDNVDALLFERFNSFDLFKKIWLLRNNKPLREKLSRNSKKLINKNFSPQREAKEYINIYRSLIK